MLRPSGVTAIALAFFAGALYLFFIGGILLLSPGTVSLMIGSALLGELGLAGPYMFLLIGALAAAIGFGLWRLYRWARWAAILAALFGIVMLVPTVSAGATGEWPLAFFISGLGIIVRVMVIWYLFQQPVAEAFRGASSYKLL